MDLTIITFIFLGLLGGVAHVVIDSEKWEDLQKFSSFKTAIIGAISGVVYFIAHSNYDFPNAFMTIVAGYFGTDFLKGLFEKYKAKKPQSYY